MSDFFIAYIDRKKPITYGNNTIETSDKKKAMLHGSRLFCKEQKPCLLSTNFNPISEERHFSALLSDHYLSLDKPRPLNLVVVGPELRLRR